VKVTYINSGSGPTPWLTLERNGSIVDRLGRTSLRGWVLVFSEDSPLMLSIFWNEGVEQIM
jgi:hypothetical protein